MVTTSVATFVKEIYLTVTLSEEWVYAVTEAVTIPRFVSFAEPAINQFLLIESRDHVHCHMNFT